MITLYLMLTRSLSDEQATCDCDKEDENSASKHDQNSCHQFCSDDSLVSLKATRNVQGRTIVPAGVCVTPVEVPEEEVVCVGTFILAFILISGYCLVGRAIVPPVLFIPTMLTTPVVFFSF